MFYFKEEYAMKKEKKKFTMPKVRKIKTYTIATSGACKHLRSTGCAHTYNN